MIGVAMEMLMMLISCGLLWTSPLCAEEIRCYCNAAACVGTGYMCKSVLGTCFSQLSFESTPDSMRSVHGCVEVLGDEDRMTCISEGQQFKSAYTAEDDIWPLLMCCKQDMCNYIGEISIDNSNNISVVQKGDKEGSIGASSADSVPVNPGQSIEISERDLWFKAAVIAVPIAGGFILVLLVLLAVRMLRNDNRRQRHLVHAARQQRSLTKAQLFVADHFYQHNESECLKSAGEVNTASSVVAPVHHHSGKQHLHHKPHHHHYHHYNPGGDSDRGSSVRTSSCYSNQGGNIYREISVKKVDRCHGNSRHGYEKIRPCSETSSGPEGSVSSVILWAGDPSALRPHCITDV